MTASRHALVSCVTVCGVPVVLKRSPCKDRKKNNLSLTIGPPKVMPNWLNRKGGFATEFLFRKNSLASRASLRMYSHALPWYAFVPDLVTKLTDPAALLP